MLINHKRENNSEHTAIITAMYDMLPDVIFSLDCSLRYTSCNHAFETFSSMREEDIIGKTDHEVFGTETPMVRYFIEMNQKVLDTRESVRFNEWVVYPDGTKRFLETIKSPLFQHGKPIGLMGFARDITEHKSAEDAAKDASQAKSQFLANMSHEIRTPMNAIIGMAELLMKEELTGRQQEYVDSINTSSHALLGIINDILDFSKIEAGKLELIPVDYNLPMFISHCSSMFQYMAKKKGLEFRFKEEGLIPGCVFGDDVRLRQVLVNLCGNAVKFTQKGFIKFTAATNDHSLSFSIQDTGMGIRKEDFSGLFELYTQADETKNRNIVGTGLGLSISKAFIEMMGGTITVESEYGEGTVFTVTVPMVLGNAENVILQTQKEKSGGGFSAPGAKILVVDDNEINLKVAVGLLNLYNIQADTALSGKEAIRMVREKDYHIVFMDHMMPEMNGIEATAEIRALGGVFQKLIIIAFTANAILGVKEMLLANGFNGFVSKPINSGELSDVLKEWLPPELIQSPQKQSEPPPPPQTPLDHIRAIAEINVEAGLSYFSGNDDLYIETLAYFCDSITKNCNTAETLLQSRDLKNFAVNIHGMKSALATIGAMGLSGGAFELEKASKAENLSFCQDNTPEFIEMVRALRDKLLPLFS
ncbi:MAG: ATP-binding protein [Oscillospiraceae bacterium]|nr:ATP-binding protein [Oscillospiraceae bacterium]